MSVKKISFGTDPHRIVQDKYDCIWIWFSPRERPTPVKGAALQWVDWKMLGQLSRFLLNENNLKSKPTTFVPTMRRLSSTFLALESHFDTNWDVFSHNCKGMNLSNVLCFAEGQEGFDVLEKELTKHKGKGFPDSIFIGTDKLLAE